MNSIFKVHVATSIIFLATIHQSKAQFIPSRWEIGTQFGHPCLSGRSCLQVIWDILDNLKPSVGVWAANLSMIIFLYGMVC